MEAHSSNAEQAPPARARRRGGGPLVAVALIVVLAAVALVAHRSGAPGAAARPPTTTLVTGQPLSGLRSALAADDEAIDATRAHVPYVSQASATGKQIALTFDDGPGPTTPELLRYLVAQNVPATFFLVGRSVAAHTDLVRTEVNAGFSVGTHTESHARLSSLPAAEQSREILTAADRITRISRHAVRMMRPPYGAFDARTLQILRDERMLMVLWSVDTKDYEAASARAIVNAAMAGASPGRIVLLHDGPGPRPYTLAALHTIIPALRKQGYRFVSVPELLRGDPPPHRLLPTHSP